MGGVVGGEYGDLNYYQAPTYQSYWGPPLIINGRLYYMVRKTPGDSWLGMRCVDIYTGEEIWFRNVGSAGAMGGGTPMTVYGQLFYFDGANGHGVSPFIWNIGQYNWTVFDANSGELVYTISNPPVALSFRAGIPGASGPMLLTGKVDDYGSIIAYYMNGWNNWLLKWNSTALLINYGISPDNLYTPPVGKIIPWSKGIEWNVTIPHRESPPGCAPGFYTGTPATDGKVVFATTADIMSGRDNFTLVAYSAKDGHELWHSDFANIFISGSTLWNFFGPIKDGIMTVFNPHSMRWWGFNASTGVKLWGPTEAYENAWDMYIGTNAAYGKLYVGTYGGRIYCHELKTGKTLVDLYSSTCRLRNTLWHISY
jgi:hypothetical protein